MASLRQSDNIDIHSGRVQRAFLDVFQERFQLPDTGFSDQLFRNLSSAERFNSATATGIFMEIADRLNQSEYMDEAANSDAGSRVQLEDVERAFASIIFNNFDKPANEIDAIISRVSNSSVSSRDSIMTRDNRNDSRDYRTGSVDDHSLSSLSGNRINPSAAAGRIITGTALLALVLAGYAFFGRMGSDTSNTNKPAVPSGKVPGNNNSNGGKPTNSGPIANKTQKELAPIDIMADTGTTVNTLVEPISNSTDMADRKIANDIVTALQLEKKLAYIQKEIKTMQGIDPDDAAKHKGFANNKLTQARQEETASKYANALKEAFKDIEYDLHANATSHSMP
jgi:hypothetical protein